VILNLVEPMDSMVESDPGLAANRSARRIYFDLSSLLRWHGPPVGIVRRQHELARFALASRPEIVCAAFDEVPPSFRIIDSAWIERLIGWDHTIDLVTFDIRRHRTGLSRLRPSRYPLIMALERRRLTARSAFGRRIAGMGQQLLWLRPELPPPFAGGHGSRFGVVPIDLALGPALALGPDVVILSVGDDWVHRDATLIGELKRRHGFRYVVMCHDLIPIMFPNHFPERVATLFRRYWTAMLSIADRILVNSRTVEADIRDFCSRMGIGCGEIAIVQPGFDVARATSAHPLPDGLQAGKYVLFVGTIEPRKGHAMLMDVWSRLLAQGLLQRRDFKLVFVGRRGWMVEDLLRQIADTSAFEGTLLHFADMDDEGLARLYHAAAFCVFPSLYEGFGLPVVEAFAYGKAMIASTGGALPETVGNLSPCLPPTDPQAWFDMMKRWIEDDSARVAYEERIRRSFQHPDWKQAAARLFEAVDMD
jgi:glycosyltransferase involved in cell wall biosynthesis